MTETDQVKQVVYSILLDGEGRRTFDELAEEIAQAILDEFNITKKDG